MHNFIKVQKRNHVSQSEVVCLQFPSLHHLSMWNVGSALRISANVNEVILRRARLVLRRVTVSRI